MPIPSWPIDLPQRLDIEGYGQSLADGRLRTTMEAGPVKMRRRSSAAMKPVQGQFLGFSDHFARLERFWVEEAGGGSLPFLIPDQTRDALALANEDGLQLLDDQGRPLLNTAWWFVLFGENPPTLAAVGGPIYRISLSLVILP